MCCACVFARARENGRDARPLPCRRVARPLPGPAALPARRGASHSWGAARGQGPSGRGLYKVPHPSSRASTGRAAGDPARLCPAADSDWLCGPGLARQDDADCTAAQARGGRRRSGRAGGAPPCAPLAPSPLRRRRRQPPGIHPPSPMRPYRASASAKMRMRIMPTNSLGCWAFALRA